MTDTLQLYCNAVLSGEVASGKILKDAVKRFLSDLDDLEAKGWTYDQESIDKVINFIYKLKHFQGKHNKQHFRVEPWQEFIISNLYGFYKQDGSRRFQTAYIEVARKNGKTAFVAALALYNMIEEGEAGPEVLIAANSKEQATIAFNMAKHFVNTYTEENGNPQQIKFYRTTIEFKDDPGFIKTLAAEADKLDGYDCSLGIIDEYHEARSTMVRDVIRSSQGMRVNPLLLTITTAGYDKSLPCYDLHNMSIEIISGVKIDESFFSVIYALDEDDDWKDPKNWLKSNPNLGITVNESWLQTQVQQAINNPSDEVGIKTKNLNVWCDVLKTWIPESYIVAASKDIKIEDFEKWDCYIGVDLSSNVDLTAVSYLFVKYERYHFFTDFYLPNETVGKRVIHADVDLYRKWTETAYIKVTPGNVTDYNYITEDILKVNERNNIVKVYYDKYNATSWATQCTELGLPLEPFSQTVANFNGCTTGFERLMLSGQVVLNNNPVIRYCLRNVEIRRDVNGNQKPNKEVAAKKVDGVIAMLQAYAAYLVDMSNYQGTNIY